ncbi:metal-dependent hydrolase [Thiofilum flexile]|uniref:metal-dependent hydrolase n=1 Tax=Thiofilum flexile TaxID=125627 RepID=UPI000376D9D6|nr:metal-dependent hydrolase [Thiofilum flexile]
MANFTTHISYAAAASGLLSVLCLQVGFVTPNEALFLAFMGTLGGILPDVDLQHSYPSSIMFSLLGIAMAFAVIFTMDRDISILEMWFVGLCVFTGIRYPLWTLFHRYTTHRGSIHSLIAALFATFMVASVTHNWLGKTAFVAWLLGLFVFLGFVLHLLLDELYSVDFSNRRIKRSFGTAMKLLDSRKPLKSGIMIVATVLAWYSTPSAKQFWDTLVSKETYQIIGARFLPQDSRAPTTSTNDLKTNR